MVTENSLLMLYVTGSPGNNTNFQQLQGHVTSRHVKFRCCYESQSLFVTRLKSHCICIMTKYGDARRLPTDVDVACRTAGFVMECEQIKVELPHPALRHQFATRSSKSLPCATHRYSGAHRKRAGRSSATLNSK